MLSLPDLNLLIPKDLSVKLDGVSIRGDKFHIVDGYLNIDPDEYNLPILLEVIHFMMKSYIRREDFGTQQAYCVHRLSRMYLELASDKRITMISKEDIEVFSIIPPDEYNSGLLKILRHFHTKVNSDGGSVVIADHVAKGISDVMRS